MMLRLIEPNQEMGRPVSRLMTTKPTRNFPTLRPLHESRSNAYAAASSAQDSVPVVHDSVINEAVKSPSIAPAYNRRRASAFAYGDTKPRDSFVSTDEYIAANIPARPTSATIVRMLTVITRSYSGEGSGNDASCAASRSPKLVAKRS